MLDYPGLRLSCLTSRILSLTICLAFASVLTQISASAFSNLVAYKKQTCIRVRCQPLKISSSQIQPVQQDITLMTVDFLPDKKIKQVHMPPYKKGEIKCITQNQNSLHVIEDRE